MNEQGMKTKLQNNTQRRGCKEYVLLFSAFFVYSFVAICSKYAAGQSSFIRICLFLALEVVFLGAYALIWQQALKHFPLVTAMASKGVVVILNLFWSVLLFHESVNILNVLGAGAIIFGIWVVATDG